MLVFIPNHLSFQTVLKFLNSEIWDQSSTKKGWLGVSCLALFIIIWVFKNDNLMLGFTWNLELLHVVLSLMGKLSVDC